MHPLLEFHQTDVGNALRLIHCRGNDIAHCPQVGWLIWNGSFWEPDAMHTIAEFAKETVSAYFAVISQMHTQHQAHNITDKKQAAKFRDAFKHAYASEDAHRLRAMITLAATDRNVIRDYAKFDLDPLLLNCKNGTIALGASEFRPAERTDFLTRRIDVAFDPSARAPLWESLLEQASGGRSEWIDFLQRMAGYSLTGLTGEQKFFACHGRGGTGKSTIINMLRKLLGAYGMHAAPGLLIAREKGMTDNLFNEKARLRGARMVTAIETGDTEYLDEVFIKAATGGDPITARFFRKEWFEFSPEWKIWLVTNHLPHIRVVDRALQRRFVVVPFETLVPTESMDRDLDKKLASELPGILNWCLEGFRKWRERNLDDQPPCIREATENYFKAEDRIGQFIYDECQTPGPEENAETYYCDRSVIYNTYTKWAKDQGLNILSRPSFFTRLRERGCSETKYCGQRRFIGLRVVLGGQMAATEIVVEDQSVQGAPSAPEVPQKVPQTFINDLSYISIVGAVRADQNKYRQYRGEFNSIGVDSKSVPQVPQSALKKLAHRECVRCNTKHTPRFYSLDFSGSVCESCWAAINP